MDFWKWLTDVVPEVRECKTKLARHTTKDAELGYYIGGSDENLEEWQRIQRKPVFHPCKYVVGFRGVDDREARLVGVYQNVSGDTPQPQTAERLLSDQRISEGLFAVLPKRGEKRHYYDLHKVWDARDLPEPLIIRWSDAPQGAMAWHQWADKNRKEIIDGLPR